MEPVSAQDPMAYLENMLRLGGIDPAQIQPKASPVVDDYGNALVMLLETVNSLGMANVQLFMEIQNLKTELEELKNG
jgi:hypothetical protein